MVATPDAKAKALEGRLRRSKGSCQIVDGLVFAGGELAFRVTSPQRPELVGYVLYENMGFEPRVATLYMFAAPEEPTVDQFFDTAPTRMASLSLEGRKDEDVTRIGAWLDVELLETRG